MKQTTIQIKTELEKVNAIRICMNGKGFSVEQELTDYVETLYKKYVPQAVREYIEKADAEAGEGSTSTSRRVTRRKPVSGESESGGTDTREQTEDAAEGDCEGL